MTIRATETDMVQLRHILRGLRSPKQAVREYALNEARALPFQRRELLVRMIQRSFAEGKRRKAFFRLAAFYGSTTLAGLIAFLCGILRLGFVNELIYLGSWFTIWSGADRAVRRAFSPDWDARKILLKEAEAEGIVITSTAADEALKEEPRLELRPAMDGPIGTSYFSKSQFHDLLDRLNGEDEEARQQALGETMFLTTEEMLTLAEMQFRRCRQQIEQEQNLRNKVCHGAYCAVFVAILFHVTIGFPVAVIAGLYALYLRDPRVELALQVLALLLREVKELHPAPITLEMLTSEPESTLLTTMKRRCPALEPLIEEALYEPEEESRLDLEDLPALQSMSAETLAAPYENVQDTLAALKRLERIGDETVLPVVERLASAPMRFVSVQAPIQSLTDFRRDTERIRKAAQECLTALNARLEIQTRTLLRSSDAPTTTAPQTLLRPLDAASPELRPDTLLRAHDPREHEPIDTVPIVRIEPQKENVIAQVTLGSTSGSGEGRE